MNELNDTQMNEDMNNTQNVEEKQTEESGRGEKPEIEKDGSGEEEKTFTQSELDGIIKDRLARERARLDKILDSEGFDKELVEREKAIELREMKADAKEALNELEISNVFFDLINFNDRDSMEKSIEIIKDINKNHIEPMVQEAVNKRLVGKTPLGATGNCASPKDQGIKNAFKHPSL